MKIAANFSFVSVFALIGCAQIAAQSATSTDQVGGGEQLDKPIALAINGFNYTDIAIDLFSVAHQGGGNILVSTPTSGGGGTTCCVIWRPGTKLPRPILVEWMRYANKKQRWCQKTVMLTAPVPAKPTAIGVHFMPDGEIQVELSEGYPDVKLHLQRTSPGHRKETGNVIHDEETASCKDGQ